MKLLQRLFAKREDDIIVVSGLPRSGTSMMMRMLEQGGIEILQDHIRRPNEDNPKGYYEFERVKKLPEGDVAWLPEAQGKAVKVIAALLPDLPQGYQYRVLFMRRQMDEILASQRVMLERRNQAADQLQEDEMARLFAKHLEQVYAWMDAQPNLEYLNVDYNAMVADPLPSAQAVNAFLKGRLSVDEMVAAVDPALHRQRHVL